MFGVITLRCHYSCNVKCYRVGFGLILQYIFFVVLCFDFVLLGLLRIISLRCMQFRFCFIVSKMMNIIFSTTSWKKRCMASLKETSWRHGHIFWRLWKINLFMTSWKNWKLWKQIFPWRHGNTFENYVKHYIFFVRFL